MTYIWRWFSLYYITSQPQDILVLLLPLCISTFNALDYGMFKCYSTVTLYRSYSYNRSDSAIVKIIFFSVQPIRKLIPRNTKFVQDRRGPFALNGLPSICTYLHTVRTYIQKSKVEQERHPTRSP
jgi:hypothetical protein